MSKASASSSIVLTACRFNRHRNRGYPPLVTRAGVAPTMRSGVVEDSKAKARVICNPASSGGAYDPEELHGELEGYELEWITTRGPGDAAGPAGGRGAGGRGGGRGAWGGGGRPREAPGTPRRPPGSGARACSWSPGATAR